MPKLLLFLLFLFCSFNAYDFQTVNNVRVVDHRAWVVRVIQETVSEVERRDWCNLKLPHIHTAINETVFGEHYIGSVTYANGFAVSIQHIDVRQDTVQQIWQFADPGKVALQGTLRMTDLTVGYDVIAELQDGTHRYTATFMHALISFPFVMLYDTHTRDFVVTVTGTVPTNTRLPVILPKDETSEVLTSLFVPINTSAGITAWGPEVFKPITEEVLRRVELPVICYDCPVV